MTEPLQAKIVAVFKRRLDLGDELPSPHNYDVQKAKGHETFARIRVSPDTPSAVGKLGLDGSMEYHRARRSQYVSGGRPETGGERALLIQTSAQLALVKEYEQTLQKPLKSPLGTMVPGIFGENLHVDGGASFRSSAVCVGDEFDVVRAG